MESKKRNVSLSPSCRRQVEVIQGVVECDPSKVEMVKARETISTHDVYKPS